MSKEITIKSLADELNISKPTVSKIMRDLGITPKKVLQKFVLSEDEAERIKRSFLGLEDSKNSQSETANQTEKTANKTENTEKTENQIPQNSENTPQIVEILKKTNELLVKQLEIKDKQIESLTLQIETLTLLVNQQQQLSAIDKIKELPQTTETETEDIKPTVETNQQKKKKSLFNFFR